MMEEFSALVDFDLNVEHMRNTSQNFNMLMRFAVLRELQKFVNNFAMASAIALALQ